jgi:transposase-like protein
VIQHAVWLDFRFTQSFREVEEMFTQRGMEFSYETARCWTIQFNPKIAANHHLPSLRVRTSREAICASLGASLCMRGFCD